MQIMSPLPTNSSIHSEMDALLFHKENLEYQIACCQENLEKINRSIEQCVEAEKEKNFKQNGGINES